MLRVQKKLDVTAERAPTRTAEVCGKLSHIGKRPNTEKYFKVMVPCDRNDREQREKCLEKERIIFFFLCGMETTQALRHASLTFSGKN